MKLSYKIFSVYLLVSSVLLITVFTTIRIFENRHFKEMRQIVRLRALTVLSYELALHYQKYGNWEHFKTAPDSFDRFVKNVFHHKPELFPPPPPNGGNPGPPPPGKIPPTDINGSPPPPFENRAVLYNADKIRIAGAIIVSEEKQFPEALKPVLISNKTVGWVGFAKDYSPVPPFQLGPLTSRIEIIYTIAGILFLFAGLVSYLLSRYILAPIDKLTQGTKALNEFKFNTRIKVDTHDELERLAGDFNRMAATLERYEQMKKQWLVDISHELRTPLSVLKGEIEAIQDGIRKPEKQQINTLHSEVILLESIVNDLHLLSKADADVLSLNPALVKPARLVTEVLGHFRTRLEQSGLTTRLCLTHPDLTLKGEENKLRQVFSNIIKNNIKYSRSPGPITIRDIVTENQYIIEIEDNGPGVPPGCLEKLFDRLYRVDSSRARTAIGFGANGSGPRGSGLGLSICKAIIQAHNGNIRADLTPAGGLKISIALPMGNK